MSQQPQWHPITMLPQIAYALDGVLESAQEQLPNLEAAQPKPYVLDDYTVNRVISVFTTHQNDLWLYEEQLRRWSVGALSATQRSEVERLQGQLATLRTTTTRILAIAAELAEGTIEKQLAKSDMEVGMEALRKRSNQK